MKKILLFSIAWCVTVLLGISCIIVVMPALAQDKSMSKTIIYTTNKADDRFQTELTVDPDGAAVLRIGSNRDRRANPVGLFRTVVPGHLLAQLSQDTASPAFISSPSQAQLIPDESFRKITVIGQDNSQLVKLVGEELATPAPFAQAETTIESIILHVMKFPVLAVAMRVTVFPEHIIAGQGALFDLVINNVGKKAFFLDSPFTWGEQTTQGELAAVRKDVPLAELSSTHQQFVPLGRGNFQASNPSVVGPRVDLGPGQGIAIRFQSDFSWAPGQYQVDIDLALPLWDDDNKLLMQVGVVSESRTIAVSAK